MTDINKAISEVVELAMSKTILAFGDDDVSQIEPIKAETIAKIKALVVEELIKEIELIDDKLYDLNKSDWGIPTKWSNKKYKGENYADLWTPNEAIHELIRGRLGEIRSIYES